MAEARISEALVLTYLAEGAANVVYKIELPTDHAQTQPHEYPNSEIESYGAGTPPPSEVEPWDNCTGHDNDYLFIKGRLLRLRKDLPTATSVVEAQHSYDKLIVPKIGTKYLVQQTLVEVPDAIIERLNLQLKKMDAEGRRPAKRRGTTLKNAGFGTLVTDMSKRKGIDLATIELKPKWLAQSPSAPSGASRCRTCALGAMREFRGEEYDKICPLYLLSQDRSMVRVVVRHVLSNQAVTSKDIEPLTARLTDFIMHCPLLPRLKDLQTQLDPNGPLYPNTHQDFRLAMTMRDFTWFLRVPLNANETIEARLGDLDLKSPAKSEIWRSTERALINDGWYGGRTDQKSPNGMSCALRPKR